MDRAGSSIRPRLRHPLPRRGRFSPACGPSPLVAARSGEGRGGSSARDRGYAPAEDRRQALHPSFSLSLVSARLLSLAPLGAGGSGGRLRVVVIFRSAPTGFVLLVLHLAGHHTRRRPPRPASRDSTAGEILREIGARLERRTSRPDMILRRRKREDAGYLWPSAFHAFRSPLRPAETCLQASFLRSIFRF